MVAPYPDQPACVALKPAANAPPPANAPQGDAASHTSAAQPPVQPSPDGPPPPAVGAPPPPGVGAPPPPPGIVMGVICTDQPMNMTCPSCHATITTELVYQNGTMVYLIVVLLLFIGCWLGCCLIPCSVNDMKDVEHMCPSCHACVGRYKRM